MSVVIRMQRAGGRNRPFYRVVVADSRAMRDGRFLEKVGFYNPLTQPAVVDIDEERVRYWVEQGAKPSESVASLLKRMRKGQTRSSAALTPEERAAVAMPKAESEKPAPETAAKVAAPASETETAGDAEAPNEEISVEAQENRTESPEGGPSDAN